MLRYPLVFFGDLVADKRFVAGVGLRGDALVEEGEAVWFFGVNPGGVAAVAPTGGEAFEGRRSACVPFNAGIQ